MSQTRCVLCGDLAGEVMVQRGIPILQCISCRHMFTVPPAGDAHVEQIYGEHYFFGGGDGYPDYLEEAPLLIHRGRKYAEKLRPFIESGDVLDVGAAGGFILKGFERAGWSGTGLEPNLQMVRYGKRELGLNMVQGTLEKVDLSQQFDLVSMIQVVAHLNDLPSAFESLRRLTKRDGLLLVETWNRRSATARIMRRHWHEYSPPSVLHWFTPQSLDRALKPYGYERVAHGRTLKWISLRHALSLGGHVLGRRFSTVLNRQVPPGWALPYPSEDLFWALYRARQ